MKYSDTKTYSILDLIPQRHPMVCVGELTEIDELSAKSNFIIPVGHCLLKNEKFTVAGLLENVAQTAAARAGYLALASEAEISIGFIASFKNVNSHKLPSIGSCIETKIKFKQSVLNMSIFTADILLDNVEILTCEVSILLEE